MKVRFRSLSSYIPAIVVPALVASYRPIHAEQSQPVHYRVMVRNLTEDQPFWSPVAATYEGSVRVFQVGGLACARLVHNSRSPLIQPSFPYNDVSA